MHAPPGHLHAHPWAANGQPLGRSPTRSALVGADTRTWAGGGRAWEPESDHPSQVGSVKKRSRRDARPPGFVLGRMTRCGSAGSRGPHPVAIPSWMIATSCVLVAAMVMLVDDRAHRPRVAERGCWTGPWQAVDRRGASGGAPGWVVSPQPGHRLPDVLTVHRLQGHLPVTGPEAQHGCRGSCPWCLTDGKRRESDTGVL